LDASGKEVASLMVDAGPPSRWLKVVSPSRFSLFAGGGAIGAMNAGMHGIRSVQGHTRMTVNGNGYRFTFWRSPAMPDDLVDGYTWFGIVAALCREPSMRGD
jgi:hypothetical protein